MDKLYVNALEEKLHILEAENKALSDENEKLKADVQWLHDLAWDLIFKTTGIRKQDN